MARVPLKIASKRETGAMQSASQKKIEKQAFRQADAIVVNAEAVKNYLVENEIATEKIKIIYNGLDLKHLTPKINNRLINCVNFGLPTDENIKFITISRQSAAHGEKSTDVFAFRANSFAKISRNAFYSRQRRRITGKSAKSGKRIGN